MRFNIRSVGLASVSLVGAALMAVSGSGTAMAADKVVMIGGIGVGTIPPRIVPLIAGGMYKNDDVTTAVWPAQAAPYTGKGDLTLGASIKIGVASLQTQVNQALASAKGNETVTILGMSAGSLVVDELLRQWQTTGTGPDPSKLNIVVEADSSRQATIKGPVYNKQYNYTYQPPVQVPYNVTVVTREYDGTSDFPDRVWNVLAVMNAYAGAIVLHDGTFLTDVSTLPASDMTVSQPNSLGGVTTSYLIPTATLPLVTLNPWLKPREAELKAKIDKGYTRNDATNGTSPTAPKTLSDVASAIRTKVQTTADTAVAGVKANLEDFRAKLAAATTPKVKKSTATASRATDLTDGNLATPTTTAGSTSTKKVSQPGGGTLKSAISKLLGKKKAATTGASSATDSSSSSTSSASSSAAA